MPIVWPQFPSFSPQWVRHGPVRRATRSTWQSTCCRSTSTWLTRRWRPSRATSVGPRCPPALPWTDICDASTQRWVWTVMLGNHARSMFYPSSRLLLLLRKSRLDKIQFLTFTPLGGVRKNRWVWWSSGNFDNQWLVYQHCAGLIYSSFKVRYCSMWQWKTLE